jgi:digeranylgeranylglycerophospholipid reductase
LVAGEYATKAGAKVLVIDRKMEIGAPVRCAEGLGAMNFDILGLPISSDFVLNTVNTAVIFSPKGKKLKIEIPYKEFALHILDRSSFEKTLAGRLKENGGETSLGTTVTGLIKKDGKVKGVRTTSGDLTGKVIIGADGIESRIGRWCGLSKRLKLNEIFTTAQHTLIDMQNVEDHIEIYFGSRYAPSGYAWMFSKGGSEANLGLGVLASTKKRPIELLENFKNERAKHAHSTRLTSGCIPSALPLPKTVQDNIILVGDSARQTNAVSGGGIANALLTGKIAGEVAGRVLTENRPISGLQEYERLWRGHLEGTLVKKFNQRRYLEDDARAERMFKFLKAAVLLKPIIPKSAILRWLRPDF